MKRSQLTLFFITGLVILIVLLIIFRFSQHKEALSIQEDSLFLERQSTIIKSYTEECLSKELMDAVFFAGLQGGYININENDISTNQKEIFWERSGPIKVSYWNLDSGDISPSLNEIEFEISEYLYGISKNCTNKLSSYYDGVELIESENYGFKDLNVSINYREVSLRYNVPLTLVRNNHKKVIPYFDASVDVPFGLIFNIGKQVITNITSNPDAYNLAYDCNSLNREGYSNILSSGNKIIINDYESFFDPKIRRVFTLQFLHENENVYGYCGD